MQVQFQILVIQQWIKDKNLCPGGADSADMRDIMDLWKEHRFSSQKDPDSNSCPTIY